MKSKWQKIKIGDYVSFQNGYAFKSKNFSDNGKYLVIRIKEIKDGIVKFFPDSARINIEDETNFYKYKVEKGDILFALTGDPVSRPNPLSWVGRISIYNHKNPALLNQRVCKAIFDKNINPLFFYYYFRLYENFFDLARRATGSANQANISTNTILSMPIYLPSYSIQEKISNILKSLDDKIELNNQINKNLEQQAQAIFKSWFIDFEPFGGVIPDNWIEGKLGDFVDGVLPQIISFEISSSVHNFQSSGITPPNGSKSINQDLKIACACCSKFLLI